MCYLQILNAVREDVLLYRNIEVSQETFRGDKCLIVFSIWLSMTQT